MGMVDTAIRYTNMQRITPNLFAYLKDREIDRKRIQCRVENKKATHESALSLYSDMICRGKRLGKLTFSYCNKLRQ
jgi:hypothetical protein